MNLGAARSPLRLSLDESLHELREARARAHQTRGVDDAIELGDEDAVSPAEVSYENIPVSQIFLRCFGDVVRMNSARHFRRGIVCPHASDPLPHFFCRPHIEATTGNNRQEKKHISVFFLSE